MSVKLAKWRRITKHRCRDVGQIYGILGRLERDGHVVLIEGEPADRDRKVYALSETGEKELTRWLGEADAPAPKSDLALKLAAARLTGADIAAVIADHRRHALQTLRELEALEGDDPIHALVREGAVLHLEAELRWLDRSEQILKGKTK